MSTYAQLLGWHRLAVAPSLQVFSDGVRALVNAGENVQRFHLEHKLHLSRTTDVLMTSMSTTTSAGLPGLLLSLESAGVKHIRLWGPAVLREFVEVVASSFASLRGISIEYRIAQPPSTERRSRCSGPCSSPSSSSPCTSSSGPFSPSSSSAPSSSSSASPSSSCLSCSSSFSSVPVSPSVHSSSSLRASCGASPLEPAVLAQWSTTTHERATGELKRAQAVASALDSCCEVRPELLKGDTQEHVTDGRSVSTDRGTSSACVWPCSPSPAFTSSHDVSVSSSCEGSPSRSSGPLSTGSAQAARGTIGSGLEVEAILLPYVCPPDAAAPGGRYSSSWQAKGKQFAAAPWRGVCWQKRRTRRELFRRSGGDGEVFRESTAVGKRARVADNPLVSDSENEANSSDAEENEEGPGESGEPGAADKQQTAGEKAVAEEEVQAEGRTCEGGGCQRSREGESEAGSLTRCSEYSGAGEASHGADGSVRRVMEISGGASKCEDGRSRENSYSCQTFRAEDQAEVEAKPPSTRAAKEGESAQGKIDFDEAMKEGGLWQRGPPPDLPLHEGGSGDDCVAYILRGQSVPGKFHPEKAKELGVPVGPLFSRLKSGVTIKLPNGVVVKPEDVCDAPQLGQVVLILHCLSPQQATYARERLSLDLERLSYVFHMTPWNTAQTAEYQELVRALTGPHTTHVLCDRSHEAVTVSPFVHSSKLQEFLHLLMPPVFPRPPAPLRWEAAVDLTKKLTTTSSEQDNGVFSVFSCLTKFDMTSVLKRNINEQEALNTFRPAFSAKRLSTLQFFSQTYEQCKELLSEISASCGPVSLPPIAADTRAPAQVVGGRASPGSTNPSARTGPGEFASTVAVDSSDEASPCTTTADEGALQKAVLVEDFKANRSATHIPGRHVNDSGAPEFKGGATESKTFCRLFPSLKILGTGAAAPSQYRNVSGLLLSIRCDLCKCLNASFRQATVFQWTRITLYNVMHAATPCFRLVFKRGHLPMAFGLVILSAFLSPCLRMILFAAVVMDCGEGSLSQIYSMCQSWVEFCEVIASVRIIFISHLHADHHLGICSLLLLRGMMFPDLRPPLVVAPSRLEGWLHFYSQTIACIPHTFIESSRFASSATDSRLASAALQMQGCCGLLTLQATEVEHIPHSFGVRVNATGNEHQAGTYSVVFSGDTRPCDSLFDLAKDATVLVHEATFEDSLIDEAIKKRHSSLTEVLTKAVKSGCKTVVLTHFSQRYPTIPVLGPKGDGNQTAKPDGSLPARSFGENSEETLSSSLLAGKQDPPFHLLFAFDCMSVPLQHIEQLASCFKFLPDAINELFAPR